MVNKLIFTHNDDTQNNAFCRLQLVVETFNTQLNETTNQNALKVPKVIKPINKKKFIMKLWGLINSLMSPV